MKKLYVLWMLAGMLTFHVSNAQNKYWRSSIGLAGGTTQYSGELRNDFYRFETVNPFFGIHYNLWLSQRLDLMLRVNMGGWGYESENSNSFDVDMIHAAAMLKVKLLDTDKPQLTPYVFGGVALTNYDHWTLEDRNGTALTQNNEGRLIDPDDLDGTKGVLPVGVGVQIRLADRLFLNIDETFVFLASDDWDGLSRNEVDRSLMHSIGISFGLSPWTDSDRDGVGDRLDKCPLTPPVAKVDELGCPLDTDMDGISDFEDQCPDVPGVTSGRGCADADGDTFIDSMDECPSHAGVVAFNGCPDTDGDGIRDSEDECPSAKGDKAFNGCADTDGDGVADPADKCGATPSTAKVDANGCPLDGDKDGVADYQDVCPAEAGTITNKGCPEVKEEVRQLFAQALTGIKFETGREVIRAESFPLLDNVVRVMNENPSYKLRITGHTDNVGDPAKNMTLSDERAKSVQQYLVSHGVNATRILSASGKGDTEPVGNNTTKEGRAINRRVEFKVEF